MCLELSKSLLSLAVPHPPRAGDSLVRVDLFTLQKAFLALPFREVEQTKPLWKTAAVKPRVELKAWAVTGDPRGEELCHI